MARYIRQPGQACAYKIGELKLKELRQVASDKLGDHYCHFVVVAVTDMIMHIMRGLLDNLLFMIMLNVKIDNIV